MSLVSKKIVVSNENLFQILSEVYSNGKLDGQPTYPENYPEEIKKAMIDATEDYLDKDSFLSFLIFLDEKFDVGCK